MSLFLKFKRAKANAPNEHTMRVPITVIIDTYVVFKKKFRKGAALNASIKFDQRIGLGINMGG
ncbi:hypothetical protein SDC9_185294 [bioreactor metagenome]|uniref:Uncharacterized protein n=1 Tax=bioreactor metagenome TaxID=1076179 RepID=A0A645HQZ2_9ZZZZ